MATMPQLAFAFARFVARQHRPRFASRNFGIAAYRRRAVGHRRWQLAIGAIITGVGTVASATAGLLPLAVATAMALASATAGLLLPAVATTMALASATAGHLPLAVATAMVLASAAATSLQDQVPGHLRPGKRCRRLWPRCRRLSPLRRSPRRRRLPLRP